MHRWFLISLKRFKRPPHRKVLERIREVKQRLTWKLLFRARVNFFY